MNPAVPAPPLESPAPAAVSPANWDTLPAGDKGDAIVASLARGGVEVLFFTSGSEIGFYQEAIAKARVLGRPAPRLVTMTHEHASLNAALGYAAVSGKPAATAAHVDAGTLHHGGAIHTALHAGLPVLITAGVPPTSYPGTSPAARNAGGHLWLQQTYDQHAIVRQYMKWDHCLQQHDDAALTVSRALQVAQSEPCGPAYLSVPPEVSMQTLPETSFPAAARLGIARGPAPDPEGVKEIAGRLLRARDPCIVVAGSGRDPATVPALVALCELLGLGVVHASTRRYLCFPMDHSLMRTEGALATADAVLVLESDVPWVPGSAQAPGPGAWIAEVALDPIKRKIPIYEITADLRLVAGAMPAIRAFEQAAREMMDDSDRGRIAARVRAIGEARRARREALAHEAKARAGAAPIDPLWLGHCIGELADDRAIVLDDTLPHCRLHEFLHCNRPGSYFFTPGTSGGWAPGAAFGARLAMADRNRDVIAVTGDGFYMFGTPVAALWSAVRYEAPFLTIVYQNRSYATGTTRMAKLYPGGYAQRGGFDGGYLDPPVDFAMEARAAGAWAENVRDASALQGALERGLQHVRDGRPAVIAAWLARHLQPD